jgi:hypothetical protein
MSIDARVRTVIINEDGSGVLRLVDRPATRKGENDGIAGQSVLNFESSPEEVTSLNGLDIWGNSGTIMLGQKTIALRREYTRIEFLPRDLFVDAVRSYHERQRA